MKKAVIQILLLLIIFSTGAFSLLAQSSYTDHGKNGVLFDLNTSVSGDQLIGGAGGRIGLSIGGVLDVGADFSVLNGKVESEDSQETNIGIRYGVMVLKQDNMSPVSLSFGGTYGYSYVASDYFDTNNQQKEGQGYSLNMELVRDFLLGPFVLFRVGGRGDFRSYYYKLYEVTAAAADSQEYTRARETSYSYGGVASIGIKNSQGRTYYVECSPTINQDGDLSLLFRSGLVFNLR